MYNIDISYQNKCIKVLNIKSKAYASASMRILIRPSGSLKSYEPSAAPAGWWTPSGLGRSLICPPSAGNSSSARAALRTGLCSADTPAWLCIWLWRAAASANETYPANRAAPEHRLSPPPRTPTCTCNDPVDSCTGTSTRTAFLDDSEILCWWCPDRPRWSSACTPCEWESRSLSIETPASSSDSSTSLLNWRPICRNTDAWRICYTNQCSDPRAPG